MADEIEETEVKPPSFRRSFTLRSNPARHVAVSFKPARQLTYNTLRLRRMNSEHNALLEEVGDGPEEPDAPDKQVDMIVHEIEQHERLMEDNIEGRVLRREALRELPQGLTVKRRVRAKLTASVILRSKRRPISWIRSARYCVGFVWKKLQNRFHDVVFSVEAWYEDIRSIEGHFGSAVGSYFYFLRWLFLHNLVLAVCVLAFVVVPQIVHDARNGTAILDLQNGFKNSVLFYGHYYDGYVYGPQPLYGMPFAYFFTVVTLYLMFFTVLCLRTAYSYRRNFIETEGGMSHVFANKVFCGWDFGIATQAAADLNEASIYTEFKELLTEQNKLSKTSIFLNIYQQLTNITINVAVIGLILGLQFVFWELLSLEMENWGVLVSIVMTLAVTICPVLFNYVGRYEHYRPRTAQYMTLARTWMLDIGSLLLLLIYWSRSNCDCWETSFGLETYRLVFFDATVALCLLPVVEFVRSWLFKFNYLSTPPEFNMAYNSLTLIYNQALLWFGMFFSPLLVVAVTLKFLLLFYVKRECAFQLCQPSRKVWRAAQTQTVLYVLVTLSLFATLFGIGTFFLRTSSLKCGPFRKYEYVISVVSEGVLHLSEHEAARDWFGLLGRPGFIAFLVLSLSVAVYYMRAKALAQHSMVEILRHMLVLQAKDKDFLLSAISKVSNGEWLYSPKLNDDLSLDSHTWKYLQEVRKPSNVGYHFETSRLNHSLLDRPKSYFKDNRNNSIFGEKSSQEDGETDSSFSWQGSNNHLHPNK